VEETSVEEDAMTDPRAQEILREALAIASGQKSGTTTAETEHVRAIGRYSSDLLNALIRLEEAASIAIWLAPRGNPAGAIDFARKVIHSAGGLTVAEETQANLVKDRSPDPVEERLDDELERQR
jgi:hypothetical protein